MVLLDVNVLIYAHRQDSADHPAYLNWLQTLITSDQAYSLSDLVLSSFIRIVTHPRVFTPPSRLEQALAFAEELRSQPNCVTVMPGPRHWDIFCRLCKEVAAKGNLVTDTYLAALAIETGSEWITTDRDYHRFPGLRVRHPLR